MEPAVFIPSSAYVENHQTGDDAYDFNQVPPGHERKGNPFWQRVGVMLGLQAPLHDYDHDGADWRIEAMRRREAAIAALNGPTPPTPLQAIVGDALDAVKEVAAKVVRVTKTERAVQWLGQVLRDGPVPQKDIEAMAVKDNIGTKPLKLAKSRLKVQSTRKGRAAWAWQLPFARSKEGQQP
jgi:hypothetical protein